MAAVRLARDLAPGMKQRGGGVILHNASICAEQPLWYEPIYNVTKAALMMFSKSLSTELIKDNIRVNCINPERTGTPMRTKAFGHEPEDSLLDSRTVARAALRVLLSENTGHVIDVRRQDPLATHELSAEAADEGNRTDPSDVAPAEAHAARTS